VKLSPSLFFALICLSTWFTGVRELEQFNTSLYLRFGIFSFTGFGLLVYLLFSKSKALWIGRKPLILITFFYFYCLISAIGNPFYLFMLSKVIECFLVIIATQIFVYSETPINQKVRFYFLFLTITISVIGASSFLYPEESFVAIQSLLSFRLRGELIPMNSNDLGCISTALMIFFLTIQKNKLGILFALLFVVLSGSRVFIVVSIFLLILFSGSFSNSSTRRWTIFALTGLSAMGLTMVFIDPIMFLLSRGDEMQLTTLHGRTFYWGLGYEVFLESPLIGSGFYVSHRFLNYLIPSYGFSSPTFDNSFLDVAVGTGLIGLSFYIGLFYWMFRKSLSIEDHGLSLFFLASTITLLFRGLTGPGLVVFGPIFVYFTFIVMCLSKVKSNEIRT
jgi:O-antigen ligase